MRIASFAVVAQERARSRTSLQYTRPRTLCFEPDLAAELGNLRNEEEVDDLKDADGVQDEQNNEPPLLAPFCGMPKGEAFPYEIPRDDENKSRRERRRKPDPTDAKILHGYIIDPPTQLSSRSSPLAGCGTVS